MATEHKPWTEAAARLLLRLAVGGLMLFHGNSKNRADGLRERSGVLPQLHA
jgi:hypothetical protein